MCGSLSRISVLTSRNVKEIMRDPMSLIFALGLPLAMEVLFYFLFHNLTAQFEMKYLAPGIAVFAQTFLTLFVGMLIAVDRGTSFLTRLYVSKAKSHEFIFSYALSVVPVVVIQSALFFLVGGLIDPSIFSVRLLIAIPLSVMTSLLFIALGILFGAVCTEKSVGGVSSIIISGQSVLSGMWFPTEGLSGGITAVMGVLPFKNATVLVQNAMNGITDTVKDFLVPLAVVLAYTIVAFAAAILIFKGKMKAD